MENLLLYSYQEGEKQRGQAKAVYQSHKGNDIHPLGCLGKATLAKMAQCHRRNRPLPGHFYFNKATSTGGVPHYRREYRKEVLIYPSFLSSRTCT